MKSADCDFRDYVFCLRCPLASFFKSFLKFLQACYLESNSNSSLGQPLARAAVYSGKLLTL